MAWPMRKRRGFRSSRPRRFGVRRFRGGKFARQKFDRIVLYNNINLGLMSQQPNGGVDVNGNSLNGCPPHEVSSCSKRPLPDPFCGPTTECGVINGSPIPCVCCSNQINFNLVNNDTLESYYQDNVTVVRLYGDVYYRALVASPFNAEYCTYNGSVLRNFNAVYRAAYAEQWHWGMRKHLRSQADSAAAELSPFDAASPAYNYDWTESSPPWLWQRFKMWFPRNQRSFMSWSKDSVYGVCANTSQASYVVPATASGSQPTYTVPAASTTCTAFAPNEANICPVYETGEVVTEPPWHHMRIRLRKHVKMTRDQDLNLICHVRHPALSLIGGWPCIDDSVFSGFPRGGDVTYQFYLRVAAVVRLN